jgi:uncharacterized protein with GYD domain
MPKYLFEAQYTADGAEAIASKGGSARRTAVEKAVKGLGGKLECFYFAFGGVDAYVIADLPNNATAAAMALAVARAGLATTNTVVLLTGEDIDKAAKISVKYKPPGK